MNSTIGSLRQLLHKTDVPIPDKSAGFQSVDELKLGATSSDILDCVKLCYNKTVISERFSISAVKCILHFTYFR